ncbi:hypothetical protein ADIS_0389 [Lunatimonas lonarensis]|uniref:Uncharacterized protein n=1 Tax=Lunatimonas lonarensis TaxID=1232681 RepID=R7ZYJ9_9BACT|nr:hypothetical protein ADIS_0389 [Lunatimonas lonarensis]
MLGLDGVVLLHERRLFYCCFSHKSDLIVNETLNLLYPSHKEKWMR